MGQDPDAIRAEIEQTRSEMGDTVEAIGYKADVPSRAKESVQEKVDTVKSKITGATERVTGAASSATDRVTGAASGAGDRVSSATPDRDQVKEGAKQAVSVAQSNPLGLAIGSAAVGFLAGMLIPTTQKEHETLGEASDQLKSQVKETAQTAVQHGKEAAQQVAQQTAATAKETAQQAAQEHGEQLKQDVQQQADQAPQSVTS